MTGPAYSLFKNQPRDHAVVTPHAIFLYCYFSVTCCCYSVREHPTIKKQYIFGPVYSFPYKVSRDIVIRQVAVHTINVPVNAGLEPDLVLFGHYMAEIAEFRS